MSKLEIHPRLTKGLDAGPEATELPDRCGMQPKRLLTIAEVLSLFKAASDAGAAAQDGLD